MKMTREELLTKLKECDEMHDTEMAHGMADSCLIEYIDDEEIARAYRAIDKWYA